MKYLSRSVFAALAVATLVFSLPLQAEDTDIYVANSGTNGTPNVLFIYDNAASFDASVTNTCTYSDTNTAPSLGNSAGGVQQCTLYNVIYGLQANSVRIGLMIYNENSRVDIDGNACGNNANGGCLAVPLSDMTSAQKTKLLAWIKGWTSTGSNSAKAPYNIKGNTQRTGAVLQEAWAYYSGKTGLSGRDYASIQPSAGCQRNFVIFVANAFKNNTTPGDGGNANILQSLKDAGATTTQQTAISIPSGSYGSAAFSCGNYTMGNHTDSSGLYADEWTRFMKQTDIYGSTDGNQGITTYTVGLLGASCNPQYPALLTSMAKASNSKYFATTDYTELKAAIDKILNEVQAVNSVFASATLPVSVNAQGTYLNQIYLGMFRPDGMARPRWVGNLKQYQFALEYKDATMDPNTASLVLADAKGNAAISSAGTGFITPDAVSFWTYKNTAAAPDSTGGFYLNDSRGAGLTYDSADGEQVDKGGAGQQIRKQVLKTDYTSSPTGPRKIYTYCPGQYPFGGFLSVSASCNAALNNSANAFTASNAGITDTAINTVGASDRTTLINWVRGQDNFGDEAGPGNGVTVRPSVHGDVLHSRPVVVNYGDARGTVVFYGANDGMFRAINGSQTDALTNWDSTTVPAGGELWSLLLPEHYGKLNRQRVNNPELKFPSTVLVGAQPKDYFVDGPTGIYQKLKYQQTGGVDDPSKPQIIDKAYLYLTMRRGGRFIYAIDVSTPTAPRVLWKIDNSITGFSELGQTWSRPRLTLLNNLNDAASKAIPVLIFGAGYDATQDAEPPTASTMGRGLYVINAETGSLIWSANSTCVSSSTCKNVPGMVYPIPSEITFADRDNDGKTDKLYFGDLGGNLWRADVSDANTASWTVTKLAALGCTTGTCSAGTTPRKFFFPPAVISVGATGASGSYEAIMLASGDREHPLASASRYLADGVTLNPAYKPNDAYNITNRVYFVKDAGTTVGSPSTHDVIESGLFDATSTTYSGSLGGYFITFANTGEKSVNAPVTVYGTTYFGTNQPVTPSATSCLSNLGKARGYALNPFNASYGTNTFDGGGLPPSPVSGLVTLNLTDGSSILRKFCIGCAGAPPTTGGSPTSCNSALENCLPDKTVPTNLRRTYWYTK